MAITVIERWITTDGPKKLECIVFSLGLNEGAGDIAVSELVNPESMGYEAVNGSVMTATQTINFDTDPASATYKTLSNLLRIGSAATFLAKIWGS